MIAHPHVKINLGLSVLRRRPDGYHDLETLFVPYHGFSDTLEIIAGDAWSETSASLFARYASREMAQAIAPDGSLMVTLARRGGVDWDPLEDSPVGAGLGGGSSDAAFALRMISELAGLDLSDEILTACAARLGSDCAFFLYDRPMFGEGRGEVLTPYEIDLSAYELRVIVPDGIAVSTAEAYKGIIPREALPGVSEPWGRSLRDAGLNPVGEGATPWPPIPLCEALKRPVEQWRNCLVNDFEATVFAAHPPLAALKRHLYEEGAVYASMSGSGSSLFALYRR